MQANLWIDKLNFINGTSITLQKDSIVVFVGPNNSGKSLMLKEIADKTENPTQLSKIISSSEVTVEGTIEDFFAKIEHRKKGSGYIFYDKNGHGMDPIGFNPIWESAIEKKNSGAPAISNFFIKKIDTIERLNIVSPTTNIDVFEELSTHPMHELKKHQNKESTFSEYFKRAFGTDIILNHNLGLEIAFHVGVPPVITAENDRSSADYQIRLRKLPFLHEQGDGMKSFAGVFLSLFAEDFSINFIDEPEAFLHPPQATLLGQLISQRGENDKQIFIATHSEHFLKGLLNGEANRLTIVRIQREGDLNTIHILNNDKIQEVWNDTLLRHSNVLDGLFHKKVVLAESDSDCRFYSAITSAIIDSENLSSPDVLFVPSGGKDRFPVIIKALKALEVPVTVIGDFDLYHNENPMKKIYEELGGDWEEIKDDFFKVKKAIDEKLPELKTDELKTEIEQILNSCTDRIFPETKSKSIQNALKKASPWRQAKASGKAYLPAGEAIVAFKRIQEKLIEKDIIILEIGEIEAFDKTYGGHGPKWVNEILNKDIINSTDLESARDFVKKFILKIV